MGNKLFIIIVVVFFLASIVANVFFLQKKDTNNYEIKRDTVIIVDTVKEILPVAKDSTVIRYKTIRVKAVDKVIYDTLFLAKADTATKINDSVSVELPITQKKYESKSYRAYVSGYEPQLDSIFVYEKEKVIKEIIIKKDKRWGVGISVGYGYNGNNFSPYIGAGLYYRIF